MKKHKGIIIVLILGILYYLARVLWGIKIPCIFHEITGFYCPGCGVTRMIESLVHGEFYQAFRYNPLVFGLLILGCLFWLVKLKYRDLKIPNGVVYVLLGITIGFGILRNIPGFYYLRPIELISFKRIVEKMLVKLVFF